MKKDHSKCCDRFRIFPFRIAKYLNDDNEWKKVAIYPDHIAGFYDNMDEGLARTREVKDEEEREKERDEIWSKIKEHYKKEKPNETK